MESSTLTNGQNSQQCQCLQPSISSNGDLHCYTTSSSLESKQQLVVLLEHAGLISTSMWQFLYVHS